MAGHGNDLETHRLLHNEETFRAANESIAAAAERIGYDGERPFICECSNSECMETIRLSADEYRRARTAARRFLVLPGHEVHGAETVVEEHGGYVVVEKGP